MREKYAIVDIETTGGSAYREKIIEIAIVVLQDGKKIEEYETLINPERSIPAFITKLTGIDNRMVKGAPKFYEIAKDIVEKTEGSIFVAHNVRFDYSFIQEEFKRLGFAYTRKQLCTVVLSRKTFPGLRSYSLGNLIRHFNISVNGRHRAMADVEATIQLFKLITEHSGQNVETESLLKTSLRSIRYPAGISPGVISKLPEQTGVYYFLDSDGNIIYIGKSINIRKRVIQHFQNINPKSNKLYNKAHSIKYEITGSELLAFIFENQEIKDFQPEINKASRYREYPYFIHHYLNLAGYLVFEYEKNTLAKRKNKQILSEHASLLSAKSNLKNLQINYGLCEKLVGLSHGEGSCFDFGIQKCQGACVHREAAEDYNIRAKEAALTMDRITPPDLVLIDKGRSPEEHTVILVLNGFFYGFAHFDQPFTNFEINKLIESIPQRTYYPELNTIIKRFLDKPGQVQVIEI